MVIETTAAAEPRTARRRTFRTCRRRAPGAPGRQRSDDREDHLHDDEADHGKGEVFVGRVKLTHADEAGYVIGHCDGEEAGEDLAEEAQSIRPKDEDVALETPRAPPTRMSTAVLTRPRAGSRPACRRDRRHRRCPLTVGAHQIAVPPKRRDPRERGSAPPCLADRGCLRLVQHDEVWLVEEAHCEADTLSLPHREAIGALES